MNNEKRNSNIELFRIVLMLIIIAHHYVVNSGILDSIDEANALSWKSIFATIFGWGGKTAIDCFVLITGYFVCKSSIKTIQWVKLLCQIEFYNIIIFIILFMLGIQPISIKTILKCIIPFYTLGTEFISSYLVFFWFIPFLNMLLLKLDQKNHIKLIVLCFICDSFLQTLIMVPNAFTYVGLFMFIYLIGAYIRRYKDGDYVSSKIEDWILLNNTGIFAISMLVISWASIVGGLILYKLTGHKVIYQFVGQSNRILAIITAVSLFVFFLNLQIKQSVFINTVAKSVFGVLLIHANSMAMINFVWKDIIKSQKAFEELGGGFVFHAIISVIFIFIVCSIIDIFRIKFLEKPFFTMLEKRKNIVKR